MARWSEYDMVSLVDIDSPLTISDAMIRGVQRLCYTLCCLLSLGTIASAERGCPFVDSALGHRVLRTDSGGLLRGVSLSFDGGDPFGSLPKTVPTLNQLNALKTGYGLNTIHLYLEGNSSTNPNPVGHNVADADLLVQRTREAGLYLIITIGNNAENGSIHSMDFATNFWNFYGPRYKDETHVI